MSRQEENPPGGEETKGEQPLKDLDAPDETDVRGGELILADNPMTE